VEPMCTIEIKANIVIFSQVMSGHQGLRAEICNYGNFIMM